MSARAEYEARKQRGEPLATKDDVYFALVDMQNERALAGSPVYYLINRLLWVIADEGKKR